MTLNFLTPPLPPFACPGAQGSAGQKVQTSGGEEVRHCTHGAPVSKLLRPFPLVGLALTITIPHWLQESVQFFLFFFNPE